MRRPSVWVGLGLLALMAAIIWSSFATTRVECEACITYDGRSKCASASAPTRDEAVRAAQDVACASLASGRAGNLACSRVRPASVSCP
jgi:hypothetical protein